MLKVLHVDPDNVEMKTELTDCKGRLRIDPLNRKCILENLKISFKKEDNRFDAVTELTNGIDIGEDSMVFLDDDPQIYVNCPFDSCDIRVSYRGTILPESCADTVKDIVVQNLELKNKSSEDEKIKDSLEHGMKVLNEQLAVINDQLIGVCGELDEIKRTFIYRVINKLRRRKYRK